MKKKILSASVLISVALGLFVLLIEVLHFTDWKNQEQRVMTLTVQEKINQVTQLLILDMEKTTARVNHLLAFSIDHYRKTGQKEGSLFQNTAENFISQVDYYTYNEGGELERMLSRFYHHEKVILPQEKLEKNEFQNRNWRVVEKEGRTFFQMIYPIRARHTHEENTYEDGLVVVTLSSDFFRKRLNSLRSTLDDLNIATQKGEVLFSFKNLKTITKDLFPEEVLTSGKFFQEVNSKGVKGIFPFSGTNLILTYGVYDTLSSFKYFEGVGLRIFGLFTAALLFIFGLSGLRKKSQLRLKITSEKDGEKIYEKNEKEEGLEPSLLEDLPLFKKNGTSSLDSLKIKESRENLVSFIQSTTDGLEDQALKKDPLLPSLKSFGIEDQSSVSLSPPFPIPPLKSRSFVTATPLQFKVSDLITQIKQDYLPRSIKEKILLNFHDFKTDYVIELNYKQVLYGVKSLCEFLMSETQKYDQSLNVKMRRLSGFAAGKVSLELSIKGHSSYSYLTPFMLIDAPKEWEVLTVMKTAVNASGAEVFWNKKIDSEVVFSLQFKFSKEIELMSYSDGPIFSNQNQTSSSQNFIIPPPLKSFHNEKESEGLEFLKELDLDEVSNQPVFLDKEGFSKDRLKEILRENKTKKFQSSSEAEALDVHLSKTLNSLNLEEFTQDHSPTKPSPQKRPKMRKPQVKRGLNGHE